MSVIVRGSLSEELIKNHMAFLIHLFIHLFAFGVVFLCIFLLVPSTQAATYVEFNPSPMGFKTTADLTPQQLASSYHNNSLPWIKYEDAVKITWYGTGYLPGDGRNIAGAYSDDGSHSSWFYGSSNWYNVYPPNAGQMNPTDAYSIDLQLSGGKYLKLFGYTQGSGSDPYFYYYYVSSSQPDWTKTDIPTASYSSSPSSGSSYPPVTVSFIDTSTGTDITGYNWSVSGNATIVTTRNLTYTFTSGGSYTVSHGVTNTAGSSISSLSYEVLTYSTPVASLTFNQTSGSAPIAILISDSSTNNPTSYNTQIYDNTRNYQYHVNSSRNFTYTFTSGTYDIYHEATNPAGTGSVWYDDYIVISGVAPTPTPTPDIPFPNQTGICQYQTISLGSGLTRPFNAYSSLTSPTGNGIENFYPAGSVNLISGQYTDEVGQYIYNEYNVTGDLLYRSSYITGVCIYPTVTATPIPTLTPFQTYPTVTGTLGPSWTPSTTITIIPVSNVSPSLPSLSGSALNVTKIEDLLISQNSGFQGYISLVKNLLTDMNNFLMSPVMLALRPITVIVNNLVYVSGLFTQYFNTFTPLFTLPYQVMTSIIESIHWKVKAVITYGLIIDTILQIYNLKRGGYL